MGMRSFLWFILFILKLKELSVYVRKTPPRIQAGTDIWNISTKPGWIRSVKHSSNHCWIVALSQNLKLCERAHFFLFLNGLACASLFSVDML